MHYFLSFTFYFFFLSFSPWIFLFYFFFDFSSFACFIHFLCNSLNFSFYFLSIFSHLHHLECNDAMILVNYINDQERIVQNKRIITLFQQEKEKQLKILHAEKLLIIFMEIFCFSNSKLTSVFFFFTFFFFVNFPKFSLFLPEHLF